MLTLGGVSVEVPAKAFVVLSLMALLSWGLPTPPSLLQAPGIQLILITTSTINAIPINAHCLVRTSYMAVPCPVLANVLKSLKQL